jgi:hypothetical protein
MGKKNNSYTASYRLKVISFGEQLGDRAGQREFGISGMQRALLEKKKILTLWHTPPLVRRSEPPMSFAFSSSFLSVDGMTCHISF